MQPAQRRRLAQIRLSDVGPSSRSRDPAGAGTSTSAAGKVRVEWRARCASAPRDGVPTAVLTAEQLEQWEADGCLLVPGLISDEVAERAERTMWSLCGLNPEAPPNTWLD